MPILHGKHKVPGDERPRNTALALLTAQNRAARKVAAELSKIESRKLEEERRDLQVMVEKLKWTFREMERLGELPGKLKSGLSKGEYIALFEEYFKVKPPAEFEECESGREPDFMLAVMQAHLDRLTSYFQFLATYSIACGVVHLSDYLCIQFPAVEKIEKDGKTLKRKVRARMSIADLMSLMSDFLEGWENEGIPQPLPEDYGVFGRLDRLACMINEIGVKTGAFVDENGVLDPAKYYDGPRPKTIATDAEDEDGAEEERDEELEKVRRGEVDVPDFRGGKADGD